MRRRIQIIIGLLIALGLPFCHMGDFGKRYSGLGPLWGGEVLWWLLFAAILVYVILVERRPLASIGFRRAGWADIAWAWWPALLPSLESASFFLSCSPPCI